LWAIAKELKIPLDDTVKNIEELPYTVSFVVRKRQQIDGLSELPLEKRPPELMIWDGDPEEIDSWIKSVLSGKKDSTVELSIKDWEIEG
jgi:hypothetical protein